VFRQATHEACEWKNSCDIYKRFSALEAMPQTQILGNYALTSYDGLRSPPSDSILGP